MSRFQLFVNRIDFAPYRAILVYVLLFFTLLRVPNVQLSYNHDSSSQFLIESLFARGYFSGVDYIQNVGYLGFLSYPDVFYPPLFWIKLAFISTATSMLAVAYVRIANANLRGTFKVLFLLWVALMSNWDSILYLFYYSVGFYVMKQQAINGRLAIGVVLPASIVALLFAFAKGTGFYLGTGLIIIICVGLSNYKYALSLLVGVAIVTTSIFKIIGIGVTDIYQYLKANSLFTQMYVTNLGSQPSVNNYAIPIVLVCLMLAQIFLFLKKRVSLNGLICAGYLLEVIAVCFLHSTIRADEHLVALLNLSVGTSLLFAGAYCNHDKVDS